MQNLGKIVLILGIMLGNLYANVTASLDSKYIYAGDSVRYMLTISGKKVKKPILQDICGNEITGTFSQTSIEAINGNYQKSYTLSYEFTPQKSCTIAPVSVEIDGKLEESNSVELIVKPQVQSKNAEFQLSLEASKKDLYVGEPFEVTLLLKQSVMARAVDSKFVAPEFKGFWIKSESTPKRSDDGEYITTTVLYTLAAQRAGTLTIDPAKLKIAKRVGSNNWGSLMPQIKWRTYFSNSLSINAKELPHDAQLIGSFTLSTSVDKTTVNANEAVKVTLKVEGKGNLEDIESFKPYVKDVNVFAEDIEVNGDTLEQKLVFVGDRDFVIPSFELVYFDTKTQKVKKIKSKPISITVENQSKAEEPLSIKRESPVTPQKEIVYKQDKSYIVGAFFLGLFIGAFVVLALKRERPKKEKNSFNIKDEKALLIRLLPYKDSDESVAKIVDILENNLYSKSKTEIDKRQLKEILKRYNIA